MPVTDEIGKNNAPSMTASHDLETSLLSHRSGFVRFGPGLRDNRLGRDGSLSDETSHSKDDETKRKQQTSPDYLL